MPADDPMAIARRRIAEEAERRTGTLNLNNLGLSALPDELFALTHLRALDLGSHDPWEGDPRPNLIGHGQFARLAIMTSLEILTLRRTGMSSLKPLTGLTVLQTLDCSETVVADLAPLAGLTALQTLNCSWTQVADLAPLAGLKAIHTLDCSGTQVADLAPLAELKAFQTLDCSWTPVADLAPLAGLKAIHILDCSGTQVADLAPLAGLKAIHTLNCSGTQVADLAPLAGLKAIHTLNCSGTPVADLAPLAGLKAIHTLNCSGTPVADLAPLAGLKAIQTLNCSDTQVADLAPLAGLTALQRLDCSHTQVADLASLVTVTDLQWIDCSGCRLNGLPVTIYDKPSLREFIAYYTRIDGLPHGLLSKNPVDSCLGAIRAHFADGAAGMAPLDDVRLLILGNGAVGKTQVARWLAGKPFQAEWDSTHGIRIAEDPEPGSPAERLRLRIWDFGGQDIYHGTHALFLRGPAVVVPAWATARENAEDYAHGGLDVRNHPLAYWLDVVRHQTDPDNPVLILKTQCDRREQDTTPFPIGDERREALKPRELCVSAKTPRGGAALEENLEECIEELRERFGRPFIGAGRLRVQRRLEALRAADAVLAPEERRHRLITQDAFEAICAEEGGVTSPEALLKYLDANGTVMYRPPLFEGQIVLDLGWALDAVYAVFNRKQAYAILSQHGGRFTQAELAALVWQDKRDEEQELLLSLMLSCGMCFRYRDAGRDGSETVYLAPDLLPRRDAVAEGLEDRWDDAVPTEVATFRYPLLHGGMIRAVLSEIGALAGPNAVYWRGGLYGFDRETKSRLIIDEEMIAGWEGVIRIRTQGGQAGVLLDRAVALVTRVGERIGMRPAEVERPPARDGMADPSAGRRPAPEVAGRGIKLEQEKPAVPEAYVSYAWRDDRTPEGQDRERQVDRLCGEARARGRPIIRDKTDMSFGDSIQDFMGRIGAGDRIFVFLSAKYLSSPACMFELSEVWRNSRQDSHIFTQRVRLFTLQDASIWTMEDRVAWAIHWRKEYNRLDSVSKEHGYEVLGDSGHRDLKRMRGFYQDTADMLDALANRVQPRTFEDFIRYGFDDPRP